MYSYVSSEYSCTPYVTIKSKKYSKYYYCYYYELTYVRNYHDK